MIYQTYTIRMQPTLALRIAFLLCGMTLLFSTSTMYAHGGIKGAQRNEAYVRPCPEHLSLDVQIQGVSAQGASDGSLHVIVSGGVPPYTCQWNGIDMIAEGAVISDLSEGEVYLVVVDAKGCDATWRGHIGNATVSSADAKPAPTQEFELQAAPNPSSGSTTISYKLTDAAVVELEVHDQTGRHLATPISALQASGAHSILFDGTEHPSGVYYCRLRVNGEYVTQSFLIQR